MKQEIEEIGLKAIVKNYVVCGDNERTRVIPLELLSVYWYTAGTFCCSLAINLRSIIDSTGRRYELGAQCYLY